MSDEHADAHRSDEGRVRDPVKVHRLTVLLAVVLTLGTGSMDAIGFSRLGDVFTSVMTGNLVLLGLSAGTRDGELAGHIVVALIAFAVGVIVAGRITIHSADEDEVWPHTVTRSLVLQLVVLTVFFVGWEAAHGRPHGTAQTVLLVIAALAMGLQSGAVVAIGVPGLSTTYVTGTLTGLLTSTAHLRRPRVDSAAVLAALVVGAAIAGILIVHAPRFAPVLPMVALSTVVVIALRSPHLHRPSRDRA